MGAVSVFEQCDAPGCLATATHSARLLDGPDGDPRFLLLCFDHLTVIEGSTLAEFVRELP